MDATRKKTFETVFLFSILTLIFIYFNNKTLFTLIINTFVQNFILKFIKI